MSFEKYVFLEISISLAFGDVDYGKFRSRLGCLSEAPCSSRYTSFAGHSSRDAIKSLVLDTHPERAVFRPRKRIESDPDMCNFIITVLLYDGGPIRGNACMLISTLIFPCSPRRRLPRRVASLRGRLLNRQDYRLESSRTCNLHAKTWDAGNQTSEFFI